MPCRRGVELRTWSGGRPVEKLRHDHAAALRESTGYTIECMRARCSVLVDLGAMMAAFQWISTHCNLAFRYHTRWQLATQLQGFRAGQMLIVPIHGQKQISM